MELNTTGCCCCENGKDNCLICGKPLVYFKEARIMTCAICGRKLPANAECQDGHFVCDQCHNTEGAAVLAYLRTCREQDPIKIFLNVCGIKGVHLHGPEHHSIIPCVLLTAYHNCGGEIELEECLQEAWQRGKKLPGGACGFLGVCGAAAGAGIFSSIIKEVSPLTGESWHIPQRFTMEALKRLVETGGPRCCKRTGRLSIEAAAELSRDMFGVKMPCSSPYCKFSQRNRECIKDKCPYYAK